MLSTRAAIEAKDKRIAELEDMVKDLRSACDQKQEIINAETHLHKELLEENWRLRNYVEESGDNLIRVGVLLDKDAIIADLEEYNIAQSSALEKLKAENERLRGELNDT